MTLHKKQEHIHDICCAMLRNMNNSKHPTGRNVWPMTTEDQNLVQFYQKTSTRMTYIQFISTLMIFWEVINNQVQKNQPKKGVLVPPLK